MNAVSKLQTYRRQFERQTGLPADGIEVSLLHTLADVCDVLGLTARERRRVIGRKGAQALRQYDGQRVSVSQ